MRLRVATRKVPMLCGGHFQRTKALPTTRELFLKLSELRA